MQDSRFDSEASFFPTSTLSCKIVDAIQLDLAACPSALTPLVQSSIFQDLIQRERKK
jgi:hypothetical protein